MLSITCYRASISDVDAVPIMVGDAREKLAFPGLTR